MHELSIASSILDSALRLIGPGTLEKVKVSVGELSSVEPELLAFAWEAAVADTPHSSSRLDIDWKTARQHCPACGQDKPRQPGCWYVACPDCSSPLELEGGFDLEILQVTFLEAESASDGGS